MIATPPDVVRSRTSATAGAVRTEKVERQRPGPSVDVGDGVFERAIGHDRQDGTENLVFHHAHLFGYIEHDRRCHSAPVRGSAAVCHRADLDDATTLQAGIIQQT